MNNNKVKRADYWRSVWSLLSTVPYSDNDHRYDAIMRSREGFQSPKETKYFIKHIERDGEIHAVPWFQTSHGVYCVIERAIPVPSLTSHEIHDAVSLIYCDFPEVMESVLSGDTSQSELIDVLSMNRQSNFFKDGYKSYIGFIDKIDNDRNELRDGIQTHETFIDEGDNIQRSDSCVIFADEVKNQPNHFHIYQYFNPFGDKGLFITKELMQNTQFKNTIKKMSICTTEHPVAKSHLDGEISKRRNHAAHTTMDGISPDKKYKGPKNTIKRTVKNGSQPLFFLLGRIHWPTFIIGGAMAAGLSYGFIIAAGFLTAVKAAGFSALLKKGALATLMVSNNPLSKVVSGFSKFVTKTLNRTKLVSHARNYDYRHDLTSDKRSIFDDVRACKMRPEFFNNIKFVPYAAFEAVISIPEKDVPIATNDTYEQWKLMQSCYADCHPGSSLILEICDSGTKELGIKMVDGAGATFVHTRPHHAHIINDNGEISAVHFDRDRQKFMHYSTHHQPTFVPRTHDHWVSPPEQSQTKTLDTDLAILPTRAGKNARARLRSIQATFTTANLNKREPKSPHPSASVAPDAPVRRL